MFSPKSKFSFDLTINELANIPQISGRCYIEVQVRDKSKSLHVLDRKPNPQEKTSSSGTVSTITSAKPIHNFKCTFDYNMRCNLKFPVKKRDNSIDNKYLILRVFYVHDKDSKEVTPLGRLEVNLTEYLDFSEPQTAKYLLKHSKVNSLLSLTIYLSELPSNFDFHTQLQVNEQVSKTGGSESNSAHSRGKIVPSGTFSIPQFDNAKRKGRSDEDDNRPLIMDPIVSKLYSKILESSWDPELHTLLEYTPEKSIQDIFFNPENPKGLNEKLSRKYIALQRDQVLERDSNGYELSEVNGLINEKVFREDLRSWTAMRS